MTKILKWILIKKKKNLLPPLGVIKNEKKINHMEADVGIVGRFLLLIDSYEVGKKKNTEHTCIVNMAKCLISYISLFEYSIHFWWYVLRELEDRK